MGGPTWTPSPSRIRPPFFLSPPEGIGRRGRGKGKGGAAPSSLSYYNSLGGGCTTTTCGLPSLSLRPMLAQHFPGGFR